MVLVTEPVVKSRFIVGGLLHQLFFLPSIGANGANCKTLTRFLSGAGNIFEPGLDLPGRRWMQAALSLLRKVPEEGIMGKNSGGE